MRKITFAIALRCFFGLESNEEQRIAKKLQDVLSLYTSSVVHQLPLNLPGMPYRTLLRAADDLDAAIHQVIHTKRLQDNASFDVMRVLLQARDEQGTLTEDELIGHMFLLFLAGHETSATALSWTLLLLEQHPHILADLHNEIAAVLGGAHPTIDTLDRMQLLDRVIKESLRIIPPVIGFGRYATYECHVGGYTIPKGSYVSISPYLTHRSPDIYPEPNQFNPERWLSTRPSAYEYLPFGAGPRLCLGACFAILEMKLVLAVILQRYRLQIKPGSVINRQWRATLAPRPGIPVTIFPQDRQFSASSIRGTIRELFHTPKQKAIK